MKEIRQITGVVATEYHETQGDENNNENKTSQLNAFDSEPGYYQQVIRPMLVPGHENELVYWLKSFGLIPNMQNCKNATVNDYCDKIMNWTPARVQDLYQWKCNGCSQKRGIRDDSIFSDVKCNFKNAIRILLGWSKGNDIDEMKNLLGTKKAVVGGLYNTCATIAEKYIRSHITEWQIGGPGIIVILDTYPDGYPNASINFNNSRPILSISEVKSIPQKYWFEVLDRVNRSNIDQVKSINARILLAVQEIVRPGSILITQPNNAAFCSYGEFQNLRHLYPTIVSVDELAKHNTDNCNVFRNLETIWKGALEVCEEAQFYQHQYVNQYLISELWRLRFGRDSFEMLLYQMSLLQ